MFRQDVASAVVPIRIHSGGDERFKVDISGSPEDKERVIALLWSLGDREHYDLEELVGEAIREIAQNLSWFGSVPYEIGRAKENRSVYLLSNFTSQRLFNLHWYLIQVVPRKDWELWKKSVTFLSRRDVWIISMPRLLGGYRGYRAILRRLRRFGHASPKFWQRDLEHGRTLPSYFNFQEYRREVDIFECRITKRWGWNRRDFSGRNWTEFMQFFRALTFGWAHAVIREHIVSELNALLARLGIKAEIRISGMPTATEILRLRSEMSEGKISFGKAFEAVSF